MSEDGTGKAPETGMCRASLAVRRSAQLPKLADLGRKRPESVDEAFPVDADGDLELEYGDADPSFAQELSEIYAYSELPEFLLNAAAFALYFPNPSGGGKKTAMWWDAKPAERRDVVLRLMADTESADPQRRSSAARAVLYLLQGNFKDHNSETEILWSGVRNAYMMFELGMYPALVVLLSLEMAAAEEEDERISAEKREAAAADGGAAKAADQSRVGGRPSWAQPSLKTKRSGSVTIHDNEELRVVLAALCHIVESLRRESIGDLGAFTAVTEADHSRFRALRAQFREALGEPVVGATPLPVLLFQMNIKFCSGSVASFPMRKVLILLWKVLLTWLGGWELLRREKFEARKKAGLPPHEDTLMIAKRMRAAKPPSAPGAVLAGLITGNRPPLAKRQVACVSGDSQDDDEDDVPMDEDSGSETGASAAHQPGDATPRPSSPTPSNDSQASDASSRSGTFPRPSLALGLGLAKSLPWAPKIRPQEVEAYLELERLKFLGFQLPGDIETTAGLPEPIRLSLQALQRHIYVSLGDKQTAREAQLNRFRFSQKEEVPETPTEQLYAQLLLEIPQHMIALLKIILSAQPSSRGKTEAMNILADVLTGEVEPGLLSNSNTHSSLSADDPEASPAPAQDSAQIRLWTLTSIDVARHKETIVKAASALLLLLLKHSRLSHILQFEHIAQHLVFANCIPLILKFFDGNILGFVQSKSELPELNFPAVVCGVGDGRPGLCQWPPDLSVQHLEATKDPACPPGYFLWRNLFSAINLLRILNKLTKWKHARIMMLVVFKSAPILKRTLKIKHALLQLFALKLLKMQAKHLGRQWRKTNMEILSSIYTKVRHRLNDDWAYGNETQLKAFDFQAEESELRSAVEAFHTRRYGLAPSADAATGTTLDADLTPLDCNPLSVLGADFPLTDRFKVNYQRWLQTEVYRANIDWDQLLAQNRGSMAMS